MAFYPVIQGPVALYNNLPIKPQFFQPSQFTITAITYGNTTTFALANSTNGVAPNYIIGQQVRITMPSSYGARQFNEQTAYIISLPSSNQVVVNINSLKFDPFIAAPTFVSYQSRTPPQMMAIGDISSGQINTNGNVNYNTQVPGSFINISPL